LQWAVLYAKMLMRYEEEFMRMNASKAPTSQQGKATIAKSTKIAELTERYEKGDMMWHEFLQSVRMIVMTPD